jgi:hypothetical protein
MKYDVLAEAIFAGLFWGAIVGAICRWAGRKLPPDMNNRRSFKWFAWTAIIVAVTFYWMHGISS